MHCLSALSGHPVEQPMLALPCPAGAWSSQLHSWLPPDLQAAGGGLAEVTGLKVHSILLRDNAGTTADALFLVGATRADLHRMFTERSGPRPDYGFNWCRRTGAPTGSHWSLKCTPGPLGR